MGASRWFIDELDEDSVLHLCVPSLYSSPGLACPAINNKLSTSPCGASMYLMVTRRNGVIQWV